MSSRYDLKNFNLYSSEFKENVKIKRVTGCICVYSFVAKGINVKVGFLMFLPVLPYLKTYDFK